MFVYRREGGVLVAGQDRFEKDLDEERHRVLEALAGC